MLRHRRFTGLLAVTLLLLNIVSSSVLANFGDDAEYTWMCTSQGLAKVALSGEGSSSNSLNESDAMQGKHCPFCALFDNSVNVFELDLCDSQPEPPKTNNYKSPVAFQTPGTIFASRPLRAPPLQSLA